MRKLLTILLGIAFTAAEAMTVYVQTTPDPCGNGTATAWSVVTGGVAPYTYAWSTGATTATITGLPTGTYSVTVTDNLGTVASNSGNVVLGAGLDILPVAQPVAPDCFGLCNGQFHLELGHLGGQAPYTIALMPPAIVLFSDYATTAEIGGICEGMWADVTITDALGCAGTYGLTLPISFSPIPVAQTTTPACPGYNNGSATLTFNPFELPSGSLVNITGPGTPMANMTNINGVVQVNDLVAGNYTGTANSTFPFSCQGTFYFTVPALGGNCGEVNGTAFVDLDQDCVQGPNDPALPLRPIVIQPGNTVQLTDAQGQFNIGLDYGSYSLEQGDADLTQICPDAVPYPFDLTNVLPTHTVDLADTTVGDLDLRVSFSSTQAVPGFSQRTWITIENHSPFPSGLVTTSYDHEALFTLIGTDQTPQSTTATNITWELADLLPYQWHIYVIDLQIPPDPTLIGTLHGATASVSSLVPDGAPANNTFVQDFPVVGAFDPNDKTGWSTSGSTAYYYIGTDADITYTVRFQNTGNAPAQNVFIIDTLSAMHELPSLEILAASHQFTAQFGQDRTLRFDFPNIQLPDSTNDEPNSHGFVTFRMKPVDGISPGSVIANEAGIYFDLNPPVITNMTGLLVTVNTTVLEMERAELRVWPNPATDNIRIEGVKDGRGLHACRIVGSDGRSITSIGVPVRNGLLDVQKLAAGPYVIEVELSDGTRMRARFIKAR